MKKEVQYLLVGFLLILLLGLSSVVIIDPLTSPTGLAHNPNHNPPGQGGGNEGTTTTTTIIEGGGTTKTIQIIPEYPKEGDTLKRGLLTLKVKGFVANSLDTTIKVTADSALFGNITLANNFKKLGYGIYGAEIILKENILPGRYEIRLKGEKAFGFDEERIYINLDPRIYLNITLADSYLKGTSIFFSGLAHYFDSSPLANNTLEVRFSAADFFTSQIIKTNDLGYFNDSFQISFAEPSGRWSIVINAVDGEYNKGTLEFKTDVKVPLATAYYTITFFSPLEKSEYARASIVPITVEVSEEGRLISNATVTMKNPKNQAVFLEEVRPGVYSTDYNLEVNDPLGVWHIPVQAKLTRDNLTKVGGTSLPINIKSAEIRSILSPERSEFFTGQKIKFTAKLEYGSREPVRNAEVFIKIGNETVALVENTPGDYTGNYLFTKTSLRANQMQLTATDGYNNIYTAAPRTIGVIKINKAELYLRLFVYNVLGRWWYLWTTIILIIITVTQPLWFKEYLNRRQNYISKEELRTIELIKEAQLKYFKHHLIRSEVYQKLMDKYQERKADLKEKQIKTKDSLKKIEKNKLMRVFREKIKSIRKN
ncbi:MAG TPA: hypothetical protein VJI98_05775 [Candidatus Nanoarchaeia archaeon]|nr:hypothetical protein [Candidatus Nanoarchaeia archaeon]